MIKSDYSTKTLKWLANERAWRKNLQNFVKFAKIANLHKNLLKLTARQSRDTAAFAKSD